MCEYQGPVHWVGSEETEGFPVKDCVTLNFEDDRVSTWDRVNSAGQYVENQAGKERISRMLGRPGTYRCYTRLWCGTHRV